MKPHPQLDEFRQAIQRFIERGPGGVLIVHEPEEHVEVMFHHDVRRVKRHPLDAEGEMRHQLALLFHRLQNADHFDRFLRSLPNPAAPDQGFPSGFNVAIGSAEQGVDVCLQVFRDLYRVRQNAWLFVTDIPDVDGWPHPLPKPAVWPPR